VPAMDMPVLPSGSQLLQQCRRKFLECTSKDSSLLGDSEADGSLIVVLVELLDCRTVCSSINSHISRIRRA
jgi:hypothetical protein